MSNIFQQVSVKRPKRNFFDLTHDVKMTLDMGTLYPCCVLETMPGDQFTIGASTLLRFSPMVAPVMHRMDVSVHYFHVPYRIMWQFWESFITRGSSGEVTSPIVPYVKINAARSGTPGTLLDYVGLPDLSGTAGGLSYDVTAWALAAYQTVYNEYYRDQNLIDAVQGQNSVGDGNAAGTWMLKSGDNSSFSYLFELRKRAWQHDYFTSCLPWAQRGDSVDLPIADFQDIPVLRNQAGEDNITWDTSLGANTQQVFRHASENVDIAVNQLYADTSNLTANAVTINDLRRAEALQKWLELNARSGSRYVENVLAHFGVHVQDYRAQRPEYITGVKTPVMISEVLNNTGSDAEDALPQGNMAGHGVASVGGKMGTYYAREHGLIMGIISVMPRTAYQQGIHRMFNRKDVFDFPWPLLAHLGEQEVLQQEVFAPSEGGDNVFGYVPRYADMKFMPSRVCGDFKSSLDFWHLGRIFESVPNLNQQFVECTPDKRIFAVTAPDVNNLYCSVLNNVKVRRALPVFGTPSL